MKKQFDDFQKMKIKECCKAIEDMTYSYINPDTKLPTKVPAKHYETILNKTVEEFLEDSIRIEMLNNVYKQLVFLQQEYGKDFIRSLICLDMNIKPTELSTAENIALNGLYSHIMEQKEKQKKKFHLLDNEFIDKYNELLQDSELHAMIINSQFNDEELEDELDDENDLSLS